jgi:hypothetical protein
MLEFQRSYQSGHMNRLFLVSIPKSGTNMLTQAIGGEHAQINGMIQRNRTGHPYKMLLRKIEGFARFGRAHLPYHPVYMEKMKEQNIKVIFMYRDPRDMMVSHIHWVKRAEDVGGGFVNLITTEGVRLNKCSDPIGELIKVYKWHMWRFIGWLCEPDVLPLRYEDMVTDTLGTMGAIHGFLGDELRNLLDCSTADQMAGRINPGTCSTFRKGIIGDWKNHFTEQHIEDFWKEMSGIMWLMRYEKEK